MSERRTATQAIKASEARARWSELLNAVARQKTRVLVEKSGVPVAAIVSPADLERLTRLDEERAEAFRLLERMREAFEGIPEEQIERDVARVIAEVRAERRAKHAQPASAT
jgi:prevent-host-death family protein